MADLPPSSSALLLGGAGISVKPYKTAAVSKYGKRSSGENLWSTKPVVSPAYPPTASRARGTRVSFLLLSCLAAPLLQGGKILLSQPVRRGTAESTAGCTSCSISCVGRVPMVVVWLKPSCRWRTSTPPSEVVRQAADPLRQHYQTISLIMYLLTVRGTSNN